jgi:hypothetical protein
MLPVKKKEEEILNEFSLVSRSGKIYKLSFRKLMTKSILMKLIKCCNQYKFLANINGWYVCLMYGRYWV